jgi:hypothetical protein
MAQQNPAPGGRPNWGAGPPESGPAKAHRLRFPRWRIFTWVILAFNLIMLIWVISGASTGKNCSGLTGEALTNCQAGNVGTGIGVGLLILLWALGDVILGVLWLVTRTRTRDCPVCGNNVRRGVTQCRACGYDFTQQLRPSAPTAGPPQNPSPPQWPPDESSGPRGS